MRALHLCSGDLWAGAEVSTFHLLTALAGREAGSVAALVLNPGVLASRLQAQGIPVVLAPETTTRFSGLVKSGLAASRSFRPDVIHSHRYKEHVLGAVIAAATAVPHVRTAHGLPVALEWDGGLRGLGSVLESAIADWTGSTWIAVSEDLGNHIAGIRRKVHVIPNGLPVLAPEPRRDALDGAFGDGLPSWYLGFVGRLEQVKRPDRFVETLAGLPENVAGRRVRGVIVGAGALRGSIEVLAARLGCTRRLRMLGARTDAEEILAALDVLVLPSDHEGLPMVLLEAMRSGVTVVATAVGGIPDGLDGAGWLVPTRDGRALAQAVTAALEDPAARRSRAEAGQARFAASYTVARMAERVLAVYASA